MSLASSAIRSRDAGRGLRDADVVLAYALALLLAAVCGRLLSDGQSRAFDASAIAQLLAFNAGDALALAAMASLALSGRATLRLRGLDYAVLGVASLFFLPAAPQNLPFLGATLAGLYFWLFRSDCRELVSLGQLWLAVSGYETWGRVFFRLVSVPVLRFETAMITKAGQALGLGLSAEGELLRSPNGWSVYILEACSSFHNVSLAVLVWLSLLKLAGESVGRAKLAALAVGVGLIVALNVSRILLMTLSETQYEFWHHGDGASVFSCLTLAAIALPTLRSMRRAGGKPALATPLSR
jgi:exosortase/archaeosortase family protein